MGQGIIMGTVSTVGLRVFITLILFSKMCSSWAQSPDDVHGTSSLLEPKNLNTEKYLPFDLLPGENIDPRTLSVSWEVADLVIPGPSGLDIVVSRSHRKAEVDHYMFAGNWQLEIPRIVVPADGYIKGVGHGVCNNPWAKNPELQKAVQLILPMQLPRTLLENTTDGFMGYPGGTKLVTTDNFIVSCFIEEDTGLPEFFLATSPDGTKYTFDVAHDQWTMPSRRILFYVSSIVDVHGNSITYSYDIEAGVPLLNKIESGTGSNYRLVEFEFGRQDHKLAGGAAREPRINAGTQLLNKIIHDGREWLFKYNYNHILEKVEIPEGLFWEYKFDSHSVDIGTICHTLHIGNVIECDPRYLGTNATLAEITTPLGARVNYDYTGPLHEVRFWGVGASKYKVGVLKERKRFDGVNTELSTFSLQNTISDGVSVTEATVQTGARTDKYLFHRERDFFGMLKNHKILDGGSVAANWEYEYQKMEVIGSHHVPPTYRYPEDGAYARPLKKKTGTIDGVTRSTQFSHFTNYGQASWILEGIDPALNDSVFNPSARYTSKVFFTNESKWLIDITSDTYVGSVDYKEGGNGFPPHFESQVATKINTVINDYGLVESSVSHGIATKFEYHPSGELYKRQWLDSKGQEWLEELYTDYKNGIPQAAEKPEGVSIFVDIDNKGLKNSFQNGRGYLTSYEYDDLDRLVKIKFPSPGSFDKYIDWSNPLASIETRGSFRKETKTDALGRVLLTLAEDVNATGSRNYIRREYYANGALKFESLPSINAGEARGIVYDYDVLGRPVKQTLLIKGDDTDPVTSICYSNCAVQFDLGALVIDPAGYYKLYEYDALGDPGSRVLRKVTELEKKAEENFGNEKTIITNIYRNILGNITLLNLGGVEHTYNYDSAMPYLVKSITRPELSTVENPFGIVEFKYDGIGNKVKKTILGLESEIYEYDQLNRLKKVVYPGASTTMEVMYGYDENGNLKKLGNDISEWNYSYDPEDHLSYEKLTALGNAYEINYDFNFMGILNSVTYPKGWDGERKKIDYVPNALGQPKQVGKYLTNISYFPQGYVENATLSSGQVVNVEANDRGYPRSFQTLGGAMYLGLDYEYDRRGNVISILEEIGVTRNDKILSYDGLNRLIDASGKWGRGSFAYDDVGNIRSKDLGGESSIYNYDENNRLSNIIGANPKVFIYDQRGNVIGNGEDTYEFNSLNLTRVGNTLYKYDGNNRRLLTTVDGTETISIYNQQGILLHEHELHSNKTSNFFYMGSKLVARQDQCSDNYNVKDGKATCDAKRGASNLNWLVPVLHILLN